MKNIKGLNVAIVGASIAGSACAVLLERVGACVSVYERRAKGHMDARGTGIGLPEDHIRRLIQYDLIDADFPTFSMSFREFYSKSQNEFKLLSAQAIKMKTAHWANVYLNLLKRLNQDLVTYDCKVSHVKSLGEQVELTFDTGKIKSFDLVIFADGYQSLGREYLFPEAKPQFADYIVWRGTTLSSNLKNSDKYKGKLTYTNFANGQAFLVTNPNLLTESGDDFLVTWLVYENKNEINHNVSPNYMSKELKDYFHSNLAPKFSAEVGAVLNNSENVFIQSIYDVRVPNYYKNNVCLVGDAATLIRPHTAAGTSKALEDVMSLVDALMNDQSLERWSEERVAYADKAYQLNRALGNLLVRRANEWVSFTSEEFGQYWLDAMNNIEWYAKDVSHE